MDQQGNYYGFTYNEWWDSLTFFVNNMINNDEIQLILQDAYSEYKQKNNSKILDLEDEIIININGKTQLLISIEDLDSIKDYFSKIKVGQRKISFEECCNKTSWNNGLILA